MKKIFIFLMLGMFLISFVSAPVSFKQNGETVFSASDNASFTGYLEYYNMVEKMNDYKSVYLLGDANTDGSVRLAIDPDTNYTIVQEKVSGVWQPGSLEIGSNTLRIGKNVGIGGVGHHVVTESGDNHLHLLAHNEFDGNITIADTAILSAYSYGERIIFQSDNTGTWTGTTLEFLLPSPTHLLAKNSYYQTDSTAATEPVRIRAWEGTDDTGKLVFDQTYPTSNFPASTEIKLPYNGYVEYDEGQDYFLRYSSDENFSFKMDTTNSIVWIAADVSYLREDNLLQTMPWENNTSYPVGQYLINNRTIMVSNDSSIQTGSFESNLDKWYNIATEAVSSFWSRTGNVLSPSTAGDELTIFGKVDSYKQGDFSAAPFVMEQAWDEYPTTTSTTGVLNNIFWIEELGLYIAGKGSGSSSLVFYTSPTGDENDWTEHSVDVTGGTSVALNKAFWSDIGDGQLILSATTQIATTTPMVKSSDGISFSTITFPSAVTLEGGVALTGIGRVLASDDWTDLVWYSDDLTTWTSAATAGGGLWIQDMAWSPKLQIIVLTGLATSGYRTQWSNDLGLTWNAATGINTQNNGVIWSKERELFFTGDNQIWKSSDGKAWTATSRVTSYAGGSALWSDDLGVGLSFGGSGDKATYSKDDFTTNTLILGINASYTFNKKMVTYSSSRGEILAITSSPGSIFLKSTTITDSKLSGTIYTDSFKVVNTNNTNVLEVNSTGLVLNEGSFVGNGNLTLGQKISFALGGFIQNIVSGWVEVNGSLNVSGNIVVDGNLNVTGNATITGKNFIFNNGISNIIKYSIPTGLQLLSADEDTEIVIHNDTVHMVVGGNTHFSASDTNTILYSPNVQNSIIIDNTGTALVGGLVTDILNVTGDINANSIKSSSFSLNDWSSDRIRVTPSLTALYAGGTAYQVKVDSSAAQLIAGTTYLKVSPASLTFHDSSTERLKMDATGTFLYDEVGGTAGLSVITGDFAYNDGTYERLLINGTRTRLYSPDIASSVDIINGKVEILGTEIDLRDINRIRIESNSAETNLISPDGTDYLSLTNAGLSVHDGSYNRLLFNPTYSRIFAPDGTYHLDATTGEIALSDNTRDRVKVDATATSLIAPDGFHNIQVQNGKIVFNDGVLDRFEINPSGISIPLGRLGFGGEGDPKRTLDLSDTGEITFGDAVTVNSTTGIYWFSGNEYAIHRTSGNWTAPNYQQLNINFATGIVIDGGTVYGKSGVVLQPNGGNVGIGVTIPNQKLEVNGIVNATGFAVGQMGFTGSCVNVTYQGGIAVSCND